MNINRQLLLAIFLHLAVYNAIFAQANIQSPKDFLGYELGEKFTYHHKVVEYYKHISDNSNQVTFYNYGVTNERRPLVAVAVSSAKNIEQLDVIRNSNLYLAGFLNRSAKVNDKPIVWLSYNVHGDEAAGTEAALKTLYYLITNENAQKWLEDVVVILDPCENPDGRDRYVNWYNMVANYPPNPQINSSEHHQPWPGGRFNHYLFDLNRDWAWQTQVESVARIKFYQQWMPQVHVDLHEMGINSPYFFAPAAVPYHEAITDWQRDFLHTVGTNNAGHFDKNGWLYFTKEVYDLLYPSYGDTWPTFNGAIGMTYEQGGSKEAGLHVHLETGNILSLADRLEHHFTSSISTIEAAHRNQERLMKEFGNYFSKRPNEKYQAYIIKYSKEKKQTISALLKLLDNQNIKYGHPRVNGNSSGFDFLNNTDNSFSYNQKDVVVRLDQPLARFVKVLFEPKTFVQDSLTYDLTAWALPYIYEIETYASTTDIESNSYEQESSFLENIVPKELPYAVVMDYQDSKDVKVLGALLQNNLVVRFATQPFKVNGKSYQRGSMIITQDENKSRYLRYDKEVIEVANQFEKEVDIVNTGFVETGKDFGSNTFRYIKPVKIALIGGKGISSTAYGELWHYMEQVIQYPVTTLGVDYLSSISLSEYDVIILPSGNFNDYATQLLNFVKSGGKIIALESAANGLASNAQTAMELKKSSSTAKEVKYEEADRASTARFVEGSIYKVHLDETHPLAFGNDEDVHIMKRNSSLFASLNPNDGWNVGKIKKDSHISGFVGSELKADLVNTTAFAVENYGEGQIIYMSDSPVFRGFWYSGQLILGNAIFLVGK
jgi:hypothetical protein